MEQSSGDGICLVANWGTRYCRRSVASDATQSLFGDRDDGVNCFRAPDRNPERCSAQTLNPLLSIHVVPHLSVGLQPSAPLSTDVALKLDHWIRGVEREQQSTNAATIELQSVPLFQAAGETGWSNNIALM